MNIWIITIGEPLPTEAGSRLLRSGVFSRYLANKLCNVTWITSGFDHYLKKYHDASKNPIETDDGYKILFLKGMAYQSNISLFRQINHIQIAQSFRKHAASLPRPDIIVCSFPPIELCDEAVEFAHRNHIPVVADVRDLWPDELANRLPGPLKPFRKPLLWPLQRKVDRAMHRATSIVGVSEAYLAWGLKHAGRERGECDALFPLGYPDSEAAARRRREIIDGNPSTKPPVEFLFVGGFNNSVDLDCVIAAFREKPSLDISGILCGTGVNFDQWVSAAADEPRLHFPGWVNSEQIADFAKSASVGLVCYRPESLVALPNKIFEYMSFGLPIINSIPGEATQLVEAEGIGLNYRAGDHHQLKRCIETLAEDSDLRMSMARRSASLFERTYNSETINEKYYHFLKSVVDGSAS